MPAVSSNDQNHTAYQSQVSVGWIHDGVAFGVRRNDYHHKPIPHSPDGCRLTVARPALRLIPKAYSSQSHHTQ